MYEELASADRSAAAAAAVACRGNRPAMLAGIRVFRAGSLALMTATAPCTAPLRMVPFQGGVGASGDWGVFGEQEMIEEQMIDLLARMTWLIFSRLIVRWLTFCCSSREVFGRLIICPLMVDVMVDVF